MPSKLSALASLKLSHKGLILVAVPLIFEIVFVISLAYLLDQTEKEVQREAHSRAVQSTTNQLVKNIYVAGTAAKGGALMLREDDAKVYRRNLMEIPNNIRTLKELVKDRPEQREIVERVDYGATRAFRLIVDLQNDLQQGGVTPLLFRDKVQKVRNELSPLIAKIGRDLLDMIDEEKKIEAASPKIQEQMRSQAKMVLAAGVIFNVLIAIWLAMYFNRGTAQRLNVLVDNTGRLARREPLNPPLTGTDEIAHLDRVFNEMAGALAVAARKETAIVSNAVDVICSVNANGKFTAINPAAHKLMGYEPVELIGTSLIDIVVEEDVALTLQSVEQAMQGDSLSFENRLRKKDGGVVDVLWSVYWSAEDGALYCVAHNITERKEVERMKREFVAMVSHDLRTPLTSIQAFLSLVNVGMYGELNESGQQNCHIAEGNISRLIALINDLLDIEKMESGRLELSLDGITAQSVFERTQQAVDGFAGQQGIMLQVNDTDIELEADGDRLVQVLINLVSNAIKFSPRGSVVTMAASSLDKGETVEFRVKDQGRGIPVAFQETIFDRFQQVESADAKQKGGSGLGLAICKAIIERHGGTIGVDSVEGEGSTFWFRIPASEVVEDTQSGPIDVQSPEVNAGEPSKA